MAEVGDRLGEPGDTYRCPKNDCYVFLDQQGQIPFHNCVATSGAIANLRRERDALAAESEELRAELEKAHDALDNAGIGSERRGSMVPLPERITWLAGERDAARAVTHGGRTIYAQLDAVVARAAVLREGGHPQTNGGTWVWQEDFDALAAALDSLTPQPQGTDK